MILHPNMTRSELTDYCRLCHEYRIKSVKVDGPTAGAIKRLSGGVRAEYFGIKFKQR